MPLALIHGRSSWLATLRYLTVTNRNQRKVVIILKELNIPYETEYVDFAKIKQEPYTKINPNGRVPAITDPSTGITLWESGAIIEYLIDQYDKEDTLTYRKAPEKYYLQQYLHFQMSGESYLHTFCSISSLTDSQARVHTTVKPLGSKCSTTNSSRLPKNATSRRCNAL